MKRFLIIILVIVIIAILGITAWTFYQSRLRVPALSFGGEAMHLRLKDDYRWQQNDPLWASDHLGNNEQAGTLAKFGCTLSSIATALSNLGMEITPQQLNQQLAMHNGYTERGWLIWDKINAVTDGRFRARVYHNPSLQDVDACLSNHEYPIVKYLIGGIVQHWVTIVGKEGTTYLMRDPLINQDAPISLSSRTPHILAVRCIGSANQQ